MHQYSANLSRCSFVFKIKLKVDRSCIKSCFLIFEKKLGVRVCRNLFKICLLLVHSRASSCQESQVTYLYITFIYLRYVILTHVWKRPGMYHLACQLDAILQSSGKLNMAYFSKHHMVDIQIHCNGK